MSAASKNRQKYDQLSSDFECLDPSNYKYKSLNFGDCFSYLTIIEDPIKIIGDNRAQIAIDFIRYHFRDLDYSIIVKNYPVVFRVFVNVLDTYKNDIKEYMLNYQKLNTQNVFEGNEKIYVAKLTFIQSLIRFIWNSTNLSVTLRKKLHEYGGTKAILSYLDDNEFIDACKLFNFYKAIGKKSYLSGKIILRAMIGSFNNLSKTDDIRTEMERLDATRILIKFYGEVENLQTYRLSCCMALANILRDSEIEFLSNKIHVIYQIVGLIEKASELLKNKDENRKEIEIVDGINIREPIVHVTLDDTSFHIIELMHALYRIAINDYLKPIIYCMLQEKSCLSNIIKLGNKTESEYGLELLLQLCFHKDVRKNLIKNRGSFNFTTEDPQLVNRDSKIFQYFEFISWLDKTDDEKSAQNSDRKVDIEQNNHILISYSKKSESICLDIKNFLENLNHSVLINDKSICGSSLEAMVDAIQSSKCVLICLTEEYKQSSFCRAEAEYAFFCKVPIIPLKMLKNYEPDGWLGNILGSRRYVDFTQQEFNECTAQLEIEIDHVKNESKLHDNVKTQTVTRRIQTNKNESAALWSSEKVKKWLNENSFNAEVIGLLDTYDGKMLNKLNQMQKTSPEFLHSVLLNRFGNDLGLLVKFLTALDELFSL